MHRVTLDGTWRISAPGDLSPAPVAVRAAIRGGIPGTVPGCVHDALRAAGLLADPDHGFGERDAQWVSELDWRYERKIDVPADLLGHDRIELVGDGLDTIVTVWLDDVELGRAANMHHPHRFALPRGLAPGRHRLRLDFTSPRRHVEAMTAERGERPVNGDWGAYAYIRKAACHFGWDWGPMLPTVGVWGRVAVEAWDGARIVTVRPLVMAASRERAVVVVHVDVERTSGELGVNVRLAVPDGRVVVATAGNTDADTDTDREMDARTHTGTKRGWLGTSEASPQGHAHTGADTDTDTDGDGDTDTGTKRGWLGTSEASPQGYASSSGETDTVSVEVVVDDPALWWPWDFGDQPLHDLDVAVACNGKRVDEWRGRIGLRHVELDTTPDADGSAFTFRINGVSIYARGANWIPCSLFPLSRDDTRAIHVDRIDKAKAAGMNMLRVWGGGVYEPDAFYAACDERGILVWQDAMLACATYPEEPPFPASFEAELRHQVARLSAHPSVVLWCGGNENVVAFETWGWKDEMPAGMSWGRRYFHEHFPRIVREVDPSRPYWPDSPSSGDPDRHPQDCDHGDRHTWDDRIEGYRNRVPRFVSEFGHQAPPQLSTLREALYPSELARDSAAMTHRQRSFGGNAQQYDEPLPERFAEPATFEAWHYLAQLQQARALAIGIEWWRAHRPRCMGALLWQLNDCWTGHSWSLLDVAGRRKPAWYAVRRAFALRRLSMHPVDGTVMLFASNDTLEPWSGVVRSRRLGFDGTIHAAADDRLDVPGETAACVADLGGRLGEPSDPTDELLVAEIGGERAFWFYDVDRRLRYPPARFDHVIETDGDRVKLSLTAETLLRDVVLAPDLLAPNAWPEENLVTLLPGETWSVRIPNLPSQFDELVRAPVMFCANAFVARKESGSQKL